MENLANTAKDLLLQLGISSANIDAFLREDFEVVVISISHAPQTLVETEDTAVSIAHLVRELTGFNDHPIVVDINYTESKRLNRLQQTVAIIIDRVISFNKEFELSNLSSFDRMLVHGYIARNHTNIITRSVGEGKDRRMTIFPKQD